MLRCGLLGRKLGHSYSPQIHHELASYEYKLYEKEPEELESFLKSGTFDGLNVTIPYKKDVIPLCDEISPLAEAIGAVNTLYWKPDDADTAGTSTTAAPPEDRGLSGNTAINTAKGRTLVGHNTDYEGFLYAAKRAGISFAGRTVLILGTGGTSLTARKAAADNGAVQIYIASRKPSPQDQTAQCRTAQEKCAGTDVHMPGAPGTETPETAAPVRITQLTYSDLPQIAASVEVIVNTTPVGTYPNNMKSVIELADFPECEAVIDVIYNPFKTALLLEAEKLGLKYTNGLPMLVAQATAAAGYFLGTPGAFQKENQRIIKAMKQQMGNIVLIGMPGTGKSLIGKLLAELTGKTLQDTDTKIEEEAKMTIPEIFEKEGESGLRDRESAICKKLGKERNLIIATGGGAILRPENVDALRQNGTLVHITRSIDKLPTRGRPLSKNIETLKKMEAQRMPLYKAAADITFRNNYTCSRKKLRQRVTTYILEKL